MVWFRKEEPPPEPHQSIYETLRKALIEHHCRYGMDWGEVLEAVEQIRHGLTEEYIRLHPNNYIKIKK